MQICLLFGVMSLSLQWDFGFTKDCLFDSNTEIIISEIGFSWENKPYSFQAIRILQWTFNKGISHFYFSTGYELTI